MEGTGGALRDLGDGVSCVHVISLNVTNTLLVPALLLLPLQKRPWFLAIEFKRTQDMRSKYAEEATKVAQKQYGSLLEGLRAVGQVKGWRDTTNRVCRGDVRISSR